MEERLVKQVKRITDVIKRNNFSLFSNPRKRPSKGKQAIVSLKQNCTLFSQLYVSCQIRQGNLEQFFAHENQGYPPSLSQFGDLRLGVKSGLLKYLEKLDDNSEATPVVDAILIDGAVLVNMLKTTGACKRFSDYVHLLYLPYIRKQLMHAERVDIIWDRYIQNSLKASTREKRGKGIRRRVEPNVNLPNNWSEFLSVEDNKTELFQYLAEQTISIKCEGKYLLSTYGNIVLSTSKNITRYVSPCTHEEADTRLLLHAADCAKQGFRKLMLRTIDTDVVVLAISSFNRLNVAEIWIAFGAGNTFRYIAVHNIVQALGPERSSVLHLHVFHAFTGCDQTSAFYGRGKTTAWATWMAYGEVTAAFISLREIPTSQMVLEAMPELERFVVLLYDRTSTCLDVKEIN